MCESNKPSKQVLISQIKNAYDNHMIEGMLRQDKKLHHLLKACLDSYDPNDIDNPDSKDTASTIVQVIKEYNSIYANALIKSVAQILSEDYSC